MERIVEVFEARFGDPYLDPTAELTFEELTAAFPGVAVAELEEGLSHWTNHSGERTLSTKTIENDGHETASGTFMDWLGIISIRLRPVLGTSRWASRLEAAARNVCGIRPKTDLICYLFFSAIFFSTPRGHV